MWEMNQSLGDRWAQKDDGNIRFLLEKTNGMHHIRWFVFIDHWLKYQGTGKSASECIAKMEKAIKMHINNPKS